MSEYTLTIRSLPSAVPSTIRLRRVLKSLLRSYDFKCTDYRLIDEPRPNAEGSGSATDAEKRASDAATRKSEGVE